MPASSFFAVIAKGFADFSCEMHLKFEFHLNFSTTSLISGNTIPTLLWLDLTSTEFGFQITIDQNFNKLNGEKEMGEPKKNPEREESGNGDTLEPEE